MCTNLNWIPLKERLNLTLPLGPTLFTWSLEMPLWKIQSFGTWYVAGSGMMWFCHYWQSNRRAWYRLGHKKLKCFVLFSEPESFWLFRGSEVCCSLQVLSKLYIKARQKLALISSCSGAETSEGLWVWLQFHSRLSRFNLSVLSLLEISPILNDGWMTSLPLFRRCCFLKNLVSFLQLPLQIM